MRNGYALATAAGLKAIDADAATLDAMRGLLRIGVQSNVEATDGPGRGQLVSHAFCSALPVAYAGCRQSPGRPSLRRVLETAYEATLLASVLNAARGASIRVLLTAWAGARSGAMRSGSTTQ